MAYVGPAATERTLAAFVRLANSLAAAGVGCDQLPCSPPCRCWINFGRLRFAAEPNELATVECLECGAKVPLDMTDG